MVNNTTIVLMISILPHILSIIITLIIYCCTKNFFKNKVEKEISNGNVKANKKYKKIKIFSFVLVYMTVFFTTYCIILYIDNDHNKKYDIFGNEFSYSSDIPLYDESGNKYYRISNHNSSKIIYEDEHGNSYNVNDIYLSKGGYIVHPNKNSVEYNSKVFDTVRVNGEYYYYIISPYWNKNGDLIVDYMGLSKEDSVIITKEEQLEYQKEKNVNIYDMITNSK